MRFFVCAVLALFCLSACGITGGFDDVPRRVPIAATQSLHTPGPESGNFTLYRLDSGDVLELIFKYDQQQPGEFVLKPMDVVQLKFLSAPDWNTSQRILPNGAIALPFAGEMVIAGMGVETARAKIQQAYKSILKNPAVSLLVEDFTPPHQSTREALSSTDLRRTVTVQTDGYVSLPLTGMLYARGVPFADFKLQVIDNYKRQLGIEVDVLLAESAGQNVYIVGAVQQPGAFKMTGPTDVLQGLALGRGFTNDANLDQVILVRREGGTMVCTSININETMDGRSNGGMTPLLAGDIVFVPRSRLSRAAEVATQISAISFFRGYNLSYNWQLRNDSQSDWW